MNKSKLAKIGILMVMVILVVGGVLAKSNLNYETPSSDIKMEWSEFKKLEIVGNIGADQSQYGYYIAQRTYAGEPQYYVLRLGDEWDAIRAVRITNEEVSTKDFESVTIDEAKGLTWSRTIEDRSSDTGLDFTRGDIYTNLGATDPLRNSLYIADGHTRDFKWDTFQDEGTFLDNTQLDSFSNFRKIGADHDGYSYYRVTVPDDAGTPEERVIAVEDAGWGWNYVWIMKGEAKTVTSLDDVNNKKWLGIDDEGPGVDWTVSELYSNYRSEIVQANTHYNAYTVRMLRIESLKNAGKLDDAQAKTASAEVFKKYNPASGEYTAPKTVVSVDEMDKELFGIVGVTPPAPTLTWKKLGLTDAQGRDLEEYGEVDMETYKQFKEAGITDVDVVIDWAGNGYDAKQTKAWKDRVGDITPEQVWELEYAGITPSTPKDEFEKAYKGVTGKDVVVKPPAAPKAPTKGEGALKPPDEVKRAVGVIPLPSGAQVPGGKKPIFYDIDGDGTWDKGEPRILLDSRLHQEHWKNVEKFDPKRGTITLIDGSVWNVKGDGSIIERPDGKERYSYENGGKVHYEDGKTTSYELPDGKGGELSPTFAKKAKIGKDGNLNIMGLTIKDEVKLSAKGNVITKKDESQIVAIEGGTMEINADKNTIIIKIGKGTEKLSDVQYEALTGADLGDDISDVMKQVNNIGIVIEALRKEGVRLTSIVGKDPGNAYWTNRVKVEMGVDKDNKKTIKTTKGKIDEKGTVIAGTDYEEATKTFVQGGYRVTSAKTLQDDKTTASSWDYTSKNTGTATIGGNDYEFSFNSKTGDVVWYEQGGKYFRVEDETWFDDERFRNPTKAGDRPEKEIKNALLKADDQKASAGGRPTSTARSVQRFWGAMETAARGGAGRFVSLFMEDEELAEWREGVDDVLCKTVIAGGTECWTSKICSKWVDNRVGGGLVYAETPAGMLTIAAHIEGERTTIKTPQKKEYLYKLTYTVNNPERDEIGFNVVLTGDKKTTLYSDNIKLKGGESSSRIGASAVVQYSDNYYNKVCIMFAEPIEIAGDSVTQVCNIITERRGEVIKTTPSGAPLDLPVSQNQI